MTAELAIWLTVVVMVLGFGMAVMVWAYRRPLGNSVLFPDPVTSLSIPVQKTTQQHFDAGCLAFQAKQFPKAIDQFMRVLEVESACAEAFHNCGLAQANLGNDGLAANALVKASEAYDHQGTKEGLDRVKQQLEQLAARRQGLNRTAPAA